MCGFAGLLTTRASRRADIPTALERLIQPILHRGPDASGVWHDPEAGVGLGFRRLAILDLSPAGEQPMRSVSSRYTIIFNGEIYNHRALRSELAALGHRFRGHSDTEVLLAAFEQWGIRRSLPRTIGMFALAVWDSQGRVLTLARDRMGKKPLYVAGMPGLVLFGSELKSFCADPDFDRSVDVDSVATYLRYLYVPAPRSIFSRVIKVPPAHLLELRDASAPLPAPEPYWDVRTAARDGLSAQRATTASTVSALGELLDDAVRIRLESDVPLGALLSGGIDSSLIVARMQRQSSAPVRTFTIGFDRPEWDESAHAAEVARHLGTSHTLLRVTGADALGVVPELPRIFDEPLGDPSQIPTVLVCRLARRDVTVALCGDGGDEVFGGYNRYLAGARSIERAMTVPSLFRNGIGRALGVMPARGWDVLAKGVVPRAFRPRIFGEKVQKLAMMLRMDSPAAAYRSLVSAIQEPHRFVPRSGAQSDLESEIIDGFPALSLADRMMLADQIYYLPDDLLAKVDRASMSTSLEVRAPLLDHRIVEFGWTLAGDAKIRGDTTKWILRELLARDVPRAMFERPKMGFSIPVRDWLTGPLRGWAEDLISPDRLARMGLLDPVAVGAAWRELNAGRGGNGFGMWGILQLIAWWEQWRPTSSESMAA
jgi:asparagine synthase (glutamine-hydrolysing)